MALKAFLSAFLFSSILAPTCAFPNSAQPKWEGLANITVTSRQEHSGLYIAPDTLAIFGGIVPNSSAILVPFSNTGLVQFYSISQNTWRTVAPLPKRLNHLNVAHVDGKIYAFGGLDDGGEDRSVMRASAESWVYDLNTDVWSPIPPIPDIPRGASAVGVWDRKIILAGGFTALGINPPYPRGPHASTEFVSVFDTITQTWLPDWLPQAARTIPGQRDHAGSAIIDGKFYVIGGFDHGAANGRGDVFILNFQNLEAGWQTASAHLPQPRGGFATGVIDNRIYLLGGEGDPTLGPGVYNNIEMYDVAANTWTELVPEPLARHSAPGITANGKIYIAGGGLAAGAAPTEYFSVYTPGQEC